VRGLLFTRLSSLTGRWLCSEGPFPLTPALSLRERIPRRDSRFELPNRLLSRLRHPLPPLGGEGKGEGAVYLQAKFMGRENTPMSVGEPQALGHFESRTARLPLPKGEGWGEGEQNVPII
jgi:hypothetical protein